MEPLRIDRHDHDGWTVVVAVGEVDVATAPLLRQVLTEAQYSGATHVAVDLDGVEFLDSFGIGVLVGAVRRAAAHDGELALVCTRERLLRLLELTRLDRIVAVVASVDELGPAGDASAGHP